MEFFGLRTFVDKWLLTCWPGIDCGDAGGWLSGIATFAAVVVALGQFWHESKRRHQDELSQKAGIAAALTQDVHMISTICEKALRELIGERILETGVLEFLRQHYFSGHRALNDMRPSFVKLNYAATLALSQLLVSIQRHNSLTDGINEHGAEGLPVRNYVYQRFDLQEVQRRIEQYADILQSCIDASKLLAGEIAPVESDEILRSEISIAKWEATLSSARELEQHIAAALTDTFPMNTPA